MNTPLPKLDRAAALLAAVALVFFAGADLRAETVLVAADAGPRGASVAGNKVYRTVATEAISQTKKARFKVIEPGDLPNQRQRPAARDWKQVFDRNRPPMNALVTITVINRVIRGQVANVSSIDL